MDSQPLILVKNPLKIKGFLLYYIISPIIYVLLCEVFDSLERNITNENFHLIITLNKK